MSHHPLTNEAIRKKFRNNFDLCNFSINIARNLILSGNQTSLQEVIDIVGERADEAPEKTA